MLDNMGIIKDIEQLKKLRNDIQSTHAKPSTEKILLCAGGGCIASGSKKIKAAFELVIDKHDLKNKISVVETGCLGPCSGGPIAVMGSDKVYYQQIKEDDAEEIITKHIMQGNVVQRLTWKEGTEQTPIPVLTDIEFFKRQTKVVLRNCGTIDPCRLEDYHHPMPVSPQIELAEKASTGHARIPITWVHRYCTKTNLFAV